MADRYDVVCIGAGPAGLTAAYKLAQQGRKVLVLEADSTYVGGISRTVQHDGFCFDIGGHRFFSKSSEVVAFWKEVLGDEMLTRPRKSRIFYNNKFYPYPLDLWKTLSNLGIIESGLCGLSYVKARLLPNKHPQTFEEWVSNQFGYRLFSIFFKTYTEKVWGMSCKEISADWAAQRIKGLSLSAAVFNATVKSLGLKRKNTKIKTLIESFLYPRKGPGLMWETAAQKIEAMGGRVSLGCRVTALSYDAPRSGWTIRYDTQGASASVQAAHVISSMPLQGLVHAIGTATPDVKRAADQLGYRDFLIVALVMKDRAVFDDNWIYIHNANVKVGRIQNFKAWSPDMVPDPGLACYGMEYFCFEGDGLWNSRDDALVTLASQELEAIGLGSAGDVIRGYVVRQPKAYPVYDQHYQDHVQVIRGWLDRCCPNLQVAGRNGMHKYNNQDHSMMTAMLAAENILAGETRYDVWRVNQDAEYHEEQQSGASGERLVPGATASGKTVPR